MKDSIDTSVLVREMAIVDYVAGHLGETSRANFENAMEQDASLRKAVLAEQDLRANMQSIRCTEPVSMSNFDDLLEKIDDSETPLHEIVGESDLVDQNDSIAVAPNSSELARNVTKPISPKWLSQYGVAASIAALAIVFGGFYVNSALEPNFDTLSSQSASEKVDFSEFAEQGRLAKMVLAEGASDAHITGILESYNLVTFESGLPSNVLYVVASKEISDNDLKTLRADSRIHQIDIFTLNDEG